MNLVYHTTYSVCVCVLILYMSGGRFLRNFSWNFICQNTQNTEISLTCIHYWSLYRFNIMDLVYHTTYSVCVCVC